MRGRHPLPLWRPPPGPMKHGGGLLRAGYPCTGGAGCRLLELYMGTSLIKKSAPWDPAVAPYLGSYGGHRGWGFSCERGTPVHTVGFESFVPLDFRTRRDQICTTEEPEINCVVQVDARVVLHRVDAAAERKGNTLKGLKCFALTRKAII